MTFVKVTKTNGDILNLFANDEYRNVANQVALARKGTHWFLLGINAALIVKIEDVSHMEIIPWGLNGTNQNSNL